MSEREREREMTRRMDRWAGVQGVENVLAVLARN